MSRTKGRLHRIETALAPAVAPDPVTTWFVNLCDGSALIQAIRRTAESRAWRRARHEDRYPPGGIRPPDFRAWVRVELDALIPRLAEAVACNEVDAVVAALDAWADEPDARGWPREHAAADRREPTGSAAFWHEFDWLRRRGDDLRSAPRTAAWRAKHPDWRPGMTRTEALAWDLHRALAAAGGERQDR